MHNSIVDMVVISFLIGNLNMVHLCDPADRLLNAPHSIRAGAIRL